MTGIWRGRIGMEYSLSTPHIFGKALLYGSPRVENIEVIDNHTIDYYFTSYIKGQEQWSLKTLVTFNDQRQIKSQTFTLSDSWWQSLSKKSKKPSAVCSLIMIACTDENKAYDDLDDCVRFMRQRQQYTCAESPWLGDTYPCRSLHIGLIQTDPDTHCNHVGKDSMVCTDQSKDHGCPSGTRLAATFKKLPKFYQKFVNSYDQCSMVSTVPIDVDRMFFPPWCIRQYKRIPMKFLCYFLQFHYRF